LGAPDIERKKKKNVSENNGQHRFRPPPRQGWSTQAAWTNFIDPVDLLIFYKS